MAKKISLLFSILYITFNVSNMAEAAVWNSCSTPPPEGQYCYVVNFGSATFDYETTLPVLTDVVPAPIGNGSVFLKDNFSTFAFASVQVDTSGSGIAFGSWGITSPNYSGSRALYNNNDGGRTVISSTTGSASTTASFDFTAIDLTELLNNASYSPTSITFFAETNAGSTVSQSVLLDGVFGSETFSFGDTFRGVTSVWWDQEPEWHQFDNVVLGNITTVATGFVPIPAAAWLFSSGLIGLIGVARRKKA